MPEDAPDQSSLLEERQGAVTLLRLNRPASKNALNRELLANLGSALARVAADPDVRAVVLTGSGGSFCSGVDLKEAVGEIASGADLGARVDAFHAVIRGIVGARQPVIAAVDGPAVGFGADLALACDLRIVSERAYFQEKFVGIGLMPDGGGTFFLPRLIGLGRALDLLLTGDPVDAKLARDLGLAREIVASEVLDSNALALAARLAEGPPLALAQIKSAVRASLGGDLEQALGREKTGQLALLASADVREGVSAFLEKRPPRFRGE
jgi:2-(1,2-epoxy-1,2-dihydrophenyl)acetyl-CoA isomerase